MRMLAGWRGLRLLAFAAFTSAGVLMLFTSGDSMMSLMTVALFGGGLALEMAKLADDTTDVEAIQARRVLIQRDVVIRFRRMKFYCLSIYVILLGVLCVLAGNGDGNIILMICGGLMAAGGGALFVALILGYAGRMALAFGTEGLKWIDGDGSCLLRWDNLASVELAEMNRLKKILLSARAPHLLLESAESKKDATQFRSKLEKKIQQNRRWAQCDLMIVPLHFGLNGILLVRAMESLAKGDDPDMVLGPGAKRLN